MGDNTGKSVKVHYTGTLSDGSTFDSSDGRDPLEFVVGESTVIKGFDEAVKTMAVGEEKTVTIPCAQAYGQPHAQLIQKIPREKFPAEIKVGQQLGLRAPTGEAIPATIIALDAMTVTLDFNHPLAGKDLIFKLKLVEAK